MPELPEVEIAARNLRAWAVGCKVESVEVDPRARRIFRPGPPEALAEGLRGRRLDEVRRKGKHLLLSFSGRRGSAPMGLLSHLGMTGKWLRRGPSSGRELPGHVRAKLVLDDGNALCYRDPRLFGRLRLVPGASFEAVPELNALGPDPLEEGIDPTRLAAGLARRRVPVKVALLDQALLPGVGNIHASEALFRAHLDPRRSAGELSRAEVRRLAVALLASMKEAIAREEGPEITYVEEPGAPNPFLVYAREGEPCPRCHVELVHRLVQAGRSTFYCPHCQSRRRSS